MNTVGRLFAAFLFLATISARAGELQQKEGLDFLDTGPIRVREQFLIGTGYYAFDPSSADILDRGRLRIDVVQSDTNTFARSESITRLLDGRQRRAGVTLPELRSAATSGSTLYFVDGEVMRTSIALRRGLGHGQELAITVPLERFDGGALDGVVEDFHRAFGLDQGGRTGARRNGYTVYVRGASGREVFRNVPAGTRLGDVALSLKSALPLRSRHWRVALENVAELPAGNRESLFSTGGLDFGTQILVTRYFRRSCFHASAGAVHVAKSDVFGTDAQTLGSFMLAYEHAIVPRSSAVLQITGSQSPFRKLRIDGLSSNAYLIDVGVKRAISTRTIVFMAVSENLLEYGSSGDIGLHAGLTWTK